MRTIEPRPRTGVRGNGVVSPLGDSVTDDIRKAMRDPEYRRAREKYAVAEEVARTLIRFRVDRGLTQKEAARALHMTESMVCRLERGDHIPNVGTMLRVAEATGTVLTVAFSKAAPPRPAPRRV
jgi:ribosome-binding protein aMBF1 (putative translation factor)